MQEEMEKFLGAVESRIPEPYLGSFSYVAKFFKVLTAESDRGMILAGAAFIDNALSRLIEAYLVELPNSKSQKNFFSFEGPLGTFSNRINMAFALGLIDLATRRDIKIIKDLRNKCAHLADEILIASDSISQPISELTCLQEFTEVLESKEPFKNLGLSDRVSGAKSRLLLNIGLVLVLIHIKTRELTRLTQCEHHVERWKAELEKKD